MKGGAGSCSSRPQRTARQGRCGREMWPDYWPAPDPGRGPERLPVRDADRLRGRPGAATGRGRDPSRGRDGLLGHRYRHRAGHAGALPTDRRRRRTDRRGHAARRDLLDHPARQAYFDQELDLDDGCCRSCSPSGTFDRAAGHDRRRSRPSSSSVPRWWRTSQPPSTGSSAGTWTFRPSSTGCYSARAATSCWSRAWPAPGNRRCWRTWPGGGSDRPGRAGVPVLL